MKDEDLVNDNESRVVFVDSVQRFHVSCFCNGKNYGENVPVRYEDSIGVRFSNEEGRGGGTVVDNDTSY